MDILPLMSISKFENRISNSKLHTETSFSEDNFQLNFIIWWVIFHGVMNFESTGFESDMDQH